MDLYFLGNFVNGTITFSESCGLIIVVLEIKYGREFIFPVLKCFGSWGRRLHSNFLKVLYQMAINKTFEEDMFRGRLSILTTLS